MNDLSARFPEAHSSDLHIRLMMSAVLNGQFDGIPLSVFSKVDWVGAAQWLADCDGEPEDEAQAIAEIEMMLAKSDYAHRWDCLSERDKDRWGDFETYCDAQLERRFAPIPSIHQQRTFAAFAEARDAVQRRAAA